MKWNQIKLADATFIDEFTKDGVTTRDYVLKPDNLSPYEAYKTLKLFFGAPNGDMFDDVKSQWEFLIESPEAFFEVYDWKVSTWSIAVYLKKETKRNGEEIAEDLLKLVVAQSSKIRSEFKQRLKEPHGLVIENPFFTYRETADSLLALLAEYRDAKSTKLDLGTFNDWMRHYDLCRAAFIMYLSSVEGFLNLIYELYLRKELREERIYERLRREQLDLKLQLAPIYCECFQGDVINSDDESFRNFHSLANLRNDFVHANLTKPMMNPVIYEDDYEFVIDVQSNTRIGIPSNFREFDSEHVAKAKDITEKLIEFVLNSMKPRYRREFKEIMNLEYIKVELEKGQLYII